MGPRDMGTITAKFAAGSYKESARLTTEMGRRGGELCMSADSRTAVLHAILSIPGLRSSSVFNASNRFHSSLWSDTPNVVLIFE